jgi:hypothetical protein
MAPSLSRGAQKKRIGADDVVKGNFSLAEEGAESHRPRSGSKFHLIDACSRGIPLPRTPQAALAFTRLSPSTGWRRLLSSVRPEAAVFRQTVAAAPPDFFRAYSRAAVLERRAAEQLRGMGRGGAALRDAGDLPLARPGPRHAPGRNRGEARRLVS